MDERLYDVAAAQRGLISSAQLQAIGLTPRQIATRAKRGELRRLYRGIYTTVHGPLPPLAAEAAALLAVTPNAVLSHITAFNLLRLLPNSIRSGTIHVSVATGDRGRKLGGITVHRPRTLHPSERRRVDGLPTTSIERTLLDCAPLLEPHQLGTALDEALAKRLTSFSRLTDLLRRHPYGPAQARLRAVAKDRERQPVTREEAERRFLELIRAAGLPEPQTQAVVYGQSVDAYWPEARFAMEVDSRTWHVQPRKFSNDRRKQQILEDNGILLSRTEWNQINNEPLQLIAHVSGQIMTRRRRLEQAA